MKSTALVACALSCVAACVHAGAGTRLRDPVRRVLDLDVGEAGEIAFGDGTRVRVKLVAVDERRDPVRSAIRQSHVTVLVDGTSATLACATYHLPVTVAGVQIDCPITGGYRINEEGNVNRWSIFKAARLRLWPRGAPWIEPGTFSYPVKQRWFASDTQF